LFFGYYREDENQNLDLYIQFFHPAQAFLNSTPQLLARDRRAGAQGAQLRPGDLRMDAAAEAAVGAGDDVFLVDDFGEVMMRSATSSWCSTRSVAWLTTPG
jgi:hypothetical protein